MRPVSRERVSSMNNQTHEIRSAGSRQPPWTERAGICHTIFILNKDLAVHQSLTRLIQTRNYSVTPFTSVQSLLASLRQHDAGVLILDVDMEEMSGLALQAELRRRNIGLKIVFLSSDGNVRKSVQALRAGAVDILEKPYNERQLLSSIEMAMAFANAEVAERMRREALDRKCQQLTPREREVMQYIVRGMSNKRTAERLGVSSRTVEIHRAKIMAKMGASSLPDLVRMIYLSSDCRPEAILVNGIAP
jgi:two-component system response regulator FixJ